jgi:thiol-disulfide isomerase/thioredoxin
MKDLPMLKTLLGKKPLTIIMVYADWCPHCHTMMPHFDAAAKSPRNTVSAVKINETMMNSVNDYLNSNVNRHAKPLRVEGYPSILLVNQKAEKVADLEAIRDTERMTKIMEESGSLAEEASMLTTQAPSAKLSLNKASVNRNLSANAVVEEVVENELPNVGSNIGSVAANSMNLGKSKSKSKSKSTGNNNILPPLNSIAPSPVPAVNNVNNRTNNTGLSPSKKMEQEAAAAFSLQPVGSMEASTVAPSTVESDEASTVAPTSASDDMESEQDRKPIVNPNELTTAQRLSGGYRQGGSLLQAMTQTTYTLAPAAALLATAAMVVKKGKKHQKHKTHRGKKHPKQKTYKKHKTHKTHKTQKKH